MADKKKKIWNFVFLIVVFLLTVYYIFKDQDIGKILNTAADADIRYLLLGILCVILFILGESSIIYYMMRTLGAKVKILHCALYSFVGFFYSCITPSASGGQPMQIYYMKKDKLPIPVTTLVLMIVTITYKSVLVLVGILCAVFGHGMLNHYLGDMIWVFYLGLFLNVVCVAGMLVLAFAPGLAKKLVIGGMRLLEKMHLLKKKEERLQKLHDSMDQYHAAAEFWSDHKRIIVNVFVITVVQRFLLFTVTYWVYLSLGLSGYGFWEVTLLQSVISVAVDMLPLPGGMGISETLYIRIFEGVFGNLLLPSMLLSRGIAYYGQMLISAVMSFVAHIVIHGDDPDSSGEMKALKLYHLRRKKENKQEQFSGTEQRKTGYGGE